MTHEIIISGFGGQIPLSSKAKCQKEAGIPAFDTDLLEFPTLFHPNIEP